MTATEDRLPQDAIDKAAEVLALCRARRWMLATAESCTGGLVAAALTAVPGSSDVVDRGVVTYSNAAKIALLGVPAATIARCGAVSAETAAAMAEGARARAGVALAVAVTGIAGPGGGSPHKPVGLVWFGLASPAGVVTHERRFGPLSRDQIRTASVLEALSLLATAAQEAPAPKP